MRSEGYTGYQAPFGNPDVSPEHIIPGTYIIYQAPGHSIEDISRAIGIDIQSYVFSVVHLGSDDVFSFGVRGIGDALFNAIRSDPGVKMVDYDGKIYPASLLTT